MMKYNNILNYNTDLTFLFVCVIGVRFFLCLVLGFVANLQHSLNPLLTKRGYIRFIGHGVQKQKRKRGSRFERKTKFKIKAEKHQGLSLVFSFLFFSLRHSPNFASRQNYRGIQKRKRSVDILRLFKNKDGSRPSTFAKASVDAVAGMTNTKNLTNFFLLPTYHSFFTLF